MGKINQVKYHLFLIVLVSLVTLSCEGPEGPAGPQGLQGETGAPGPQGSQGEPGTANVIYSEWIDSDWTEYSTKEWEMLIEDSNISVDFSNNGGTVMVYRRNGPSDDAWVFPLPSGSAYPIAFAMDPVNATLLIAVESSCCDIPSWFHDIQFRYVLIPGGILTDGFQAKPDLANYQVVQSFYGIPD